MTLTEVLPRLRPALVPALLTAIAYADPGNFAVNVSAGSSFGYSLIWVVILASAAAAVIQHLAARLGAASGKSLAELLHERRSPGWRMAHWVLAELVVIMTDLAEVVGGAVALQLLFGIPPAVGACLVAVFSLVVLAYRRRGHDRFGPIVLALLVTIVGLVGLIIGALGVDVGAFFGGFRPQIPHGAALLAVGIVGATVMPHAVHFHSAQARHSTSNAQVVGWAVGIAMLLAGSVNVMLIMLAARLPDRAGDSLELIHAELPGWTALAFALALLASGAAATVVSVYTGQIVLAGFWRRAISPWLQRVFAVVPALALLILGLDPSTALVLSQVVLAFALPATLIPLIRFTASRDVMGAAVSTRGVTLAATLITAIIVGMDGYLLFDALRGTT